MAPPVPEVADPVPARPVVLPHRFDAMLHAVGLYQVL
jgi:hypothetical protein